MSEQQIATTTPRKNVREMIEGMKGQFQMALPRLVTADRFIRVALTCINKNPKLLLCTKESLLACLLDCAQLGIEPDGRRAHLIPFNDRRKNTMVCTLIIDYKGLAELIRRSGEISTLHAGIVYPDDEFEYQFGTGQFLKHKPSLERGDNKPIAVYSYVKLKDGQEDFDVMGISEVERVRKRSRAAGEGPWVTDFDEMAKKTVFRRHSKMLPLSPELRDKIEKDDEPLTEQERFVAAKQVTDIKFDEPALPEVAESDNVSVHIDQPEGAMASDGKHYPAGTILPPGVSPVPPEAIEQDKPKRKRRTKAEMEAAKAAAESGDQMRGAMEQKPSDVTVGVPTIKPLSPLGHLRLLISGSPVKEEEFVKHLIASMRMEPHEKLETLSEERLKGFLEQFMMIAGEILDK